VTSGSGWLGRLRLELEKSPHGTQLRRSLHEGPLRIQRVLSPEGPQCPHIYLLHPPGGVVGGDRLETSIQVREGGSALFTTPAAQKLYRSHGEYATIENVLEAARGATLEWLPSETLAFSAARARVTTRVNLAEDAAFVGWDIACYGMPARGEAFERGHVRTRFEIYRTQTPILVESFDLQAEADLLKCAHALRGHPVVGSLYAAPPASVDDALVADLRARFEGAPRCLVSVTSLDELLVVRALGAGVEGVRALLVQAWEKLRPAVLKRPAVLPRIWAT
jgi:urease accessory protein